ncbi:MAG: regulatory iron-sulfur-containing complex subunit RicT [Thermodesulfobacteriaceae bacterium]|nr:regulatory iron-sulfur-containing complex subunit RicT [Thermodesulfobacteriaceae bacterium]
MDITENKESFYTFGFLKEKRPDVLLKLGKPVSKGSYVLAEMPEGRREVFMVKDYCFKLPMDIVNIPMVLRKANPKEISSYAKRRELEKKGKELCLRFAQELGVEMNLVDVECYFDKSKIIFYYTAEGRIDFRELVKQLASALRMRIEMRQIGVRNETSHWGGIGLCGKEFCCAQFLKNFPSLSIKMAKDQGLILDPNKISGSCGRLLCCLSFEAKHYQEFLSSLPKIGSKMSFSGKSFRVVKYNLFQETVVLEGEDGNFYTLNLSEFKTFQTSEEEVFEEDYQEWKE